MKLQKLIYFAHGWHLALTSKPLIAERIQAWKYGPVIGSLWREFKEYGNYPIPRKATSLRASNNPVAPVEVYEPTIDDEPSEDDKRLAKAILDRILSVYGKFNGLQLSDMTHREGTPWQVVQRTYPAGLPLGVNIPNELIQEHFQGQLNKKGSQG